MLWSSNCAVANNAPKYNVLAKYNPEQQVTMSPNAANSSSTVIPFTSANAVVQVGWVAWAPGLVPAGDKVTVANTTAITLGTALTASVGTTTPITFTKVQNVDLFENTTPSVFKGANNEIAGIYGVTPTMVAVAQTAGKKGTVPGWYLTKQGMGPLIGATFTNPGTGYANTDTVAFTSTLTGSANTVGTVVTDGSGVVKSVGNFTNGGGLFVNAASVTVAALGAANTLVAGIPTALTTSAANGTSTELLFASAANAAVNATATWVASGLGITGFNVVSAANTTSITLTTPLTVADPGSTVYQFWKRPNANTTSSIIEFVGANTIVASGFKANGLGVPVDDVVSACNTTTITLTTPLTLAVPPLESITFKGPSVGASFAATPVLGGRAGRLSKECLVSLPSMSDAGSSNTTMFPNA